MEPGIIVHMGLSSLYPAVELKWVSRHQRTQRGSFKVSCYCFSSVAIMEVTEQFVGIEWFLKSQDMV